MLIDFFRVRPKSRRVKLKSKKGVLFSNPGMVKKIIFYSGTWLLLGSLVYAVYLFWPIASSFFRYKTVQKSYENLTAVPTPTVMPDDSDYSITIPRILAFSKIEDGVSPYDRNEYLRVLENNVVAQAKYTDYPGSGKGRMTYIFAHSTSQGLDMVRKNSVFYLLGELKNNDIIFIVKEGKSYTYRVYESKIVAASETEFLKYSDPSREVLILQTCWPIGTDWKRLLVFAELI